jgi:hypothetical protein
MDRTDKAARPKVQFFAGTRIAQVSEFHEYNFNIVESI